MHVSDRTASLLSCMTHNAVIRRHYFGAEIGVQRVQQARAASLTVHIAEVYLGLASVELAGGDCAAALAHLQAARPL
jgi:hypothetical protein